MIQNVGSNVGVICNLVLFMGLFATSISAIPVQMSVAGTIKYPIKIACECDYSLYVDGKYIHHDKTEVKSFDYLETGWNETKRFYPYIYEESPKIIAFNGVGNIQPGFLNGFIMDMNNGADYTKYQEWKCKDFSKTVEKTPSPSWFTYDYDDSDWSISRSYGANYQNNSFQIFETERREIHLQAEWLWTQDNSVANIYCRKKNTATSPLSSVPLTTSVPPPPVTTTAEPTRMPTTALPTHVPTTIYRPSTTALPTHVSTTATHPRVPTTATHPHVSTTATHTRVSTTIHHSPTTTAPPHVSKPIHHPPTTTTAHPQVPTTTHPHVPTTIHHTISPINIKIVINNIKYSKGISDQQVAHLLENVKFYRDRDRDNSNQQNKEYYTHHNLDQYDHANLYRTVISARLDIIRHYENLIHHFERLERLERLEHKSYDEQTNNYDNYDDHTQSESSESKTSKSNIIQSMIKLNSHIKTIENSIHFIKGNHKYLLLRLLKNLKQQYEKDTMKIFNI